MADARALLLASFVVAIGAVGWALLQVDWTPPRPSVACEDVFDGPLTLVAPSEPRDAFRIAGVLHASRPAVIVQHQIVDANGFGWVNVSVPVDAPTVYRAELPRVPRTHTIRVGILVPAEADRVRAIETSARAFDLRTWWRVRGWLTPALTPCQSFSVEGP